MCCVVQSVDVCIACVLFPSSLLYQAIRPLRGITLGLPGPGAVGFVLLIDEQQHPGMACAGSWGCAERGDVDVG